MFDIINNTVLDYSSTGVFDFKKWQQQLEEEYNVRPFRYTFIYYFVHTINRALLM